METLVCMMVAQIVMLTYYVSPQHQRWILLWQKRLNIPSDILLHFIAVQQMAAEGQSNKIASGMEVYMKRRCGTELFQEKNN